LLWTSVSIYSAPVANWSAGLELLLPGSELLADPRMDLVGTVRELAGAGVRLTGPCGEFAGPVFQPGRPGGRLAGALLKPRGAICDPAGNQGVETQEVNQQQSETGDGDLLGAGRGLASSGTALCYRWFLYGDTGSSLPPVSGCDAANIRKGP
jgi:hypothetical protein